MTVIHMCLSVEGWLKQHESAPDEVWEQMFKNLNGAQAKQYLRDCLKIGRDVIPMHECVLFDYRTGCACSLVEGLEGVTDGE